MGRLGVGTAAALAALGLLLAACQSDGATKPAARAATPVTSLAQLPTYKQITPRNVTPSGDYIHDWSGMTLQKVVGDFERIRVMAFDEAATDVSGIYSLDLPDGRMLINTYIYPMAAPATAAGCQPEFTPVKQNIRDRLPDAALVAETEETVPGLGSGLVAIYDATGDVLGPVMPIRTEAHLYCGVQGVWLVKYRITYPRGASVASAVEAFIGTSPSRL